MDTNESTHPATWRETLLSLGPGLFFPLVFLFVVPLTTLLGKMDNPYIALGVFLTLLGIFLILMVAGWTKNFPRWVFPYWGFILVIIFYLRNFNGTIAGHEFTGDWWAWMPLFIVAVVGSLWARNLQPILGLIKSVWKDWTLLSFAFYGALPLLVLAAYDEVHNEGLAVATINLILAIGVVTYMRTENIWHRFAALVGGFSIGWLALMTHLALYWNGRQLFWMTEPGSWVETLNWTSQMGALLMLILVAPVLVAFLHWLANSRRTPKPA